MLTVKGVVHKGKRGYAIIAADHPIFACGKTLDIAHVRWVSACHVYFRPTGKATGITSGSVIDQPILV